MKEKNLQVSGIILTAVYGLLIVWLYAAEPKTLTELPSKAQSSFEKAATTAQILTNTYEIDNAKFNDGLAAFRADNFIAARDYFAQADPEKLDANTQFYIAYAFYRQGFGKVYSDDALFRRGLEQINSVAALDKNFRSGDADLSLKTPAELKNEFEEGLKITADDFNPLKVLRQRK